ncbi:uncharacterized protein LOC124840738 [Vigna umbellata]|uniref:uncharacterized protein LOC124840738 n=1 Tax=Vigna umbellata TaxID=87088 RepID=UPI001F5E788C|nr:uncharacterized protein LOC124840738 [Vigna umbellata]
MWEGKDAVLSFVISPLKILWDSLRIIHTNKLIFCFILCFTTLPLSFLTFTLAISTHQLRSKIYHLEAVASVAHTRVEARHVWHESRDNAVSLLRTRLLYALLSFPISLAAAVSAIHTAAHGKPISPRAANWKGPAVTVVFVYVLLMAFSLVPRVLAAATFGSPLLIRVLTRIIGSGAEVYLLSVLSLGIVVSVAEDRVGWDAIRVGWGLIQGGRVCGWVLSALFVFVSGFINRKVEAMLENRNTEIGVWNKPLLMCFYAVVVVFSYVVTTVFYCDSRRRHDNNINNVKESQGDDDDGVQGFDADSSSEL